MPIHGWSKVDAAIFDHFHHGWIAEIARELNGGALPGDYYAMAEQHTSHFGPDVLTLQSRSTHETDQVEQRGLGAGFPSRDGGVVVSRPKARYVGESDLEFYRRKQNVVAVRHVSGDRLVAIVEIVSPANSRARLGFGNSSTRQLNF
jgi:hypothetical protein